MVMPGACNHCRRMKMRCVGANDPPCKRCRNGGLECIQEKPVRGHPPPEAPSDEPRIRSLETQVAGMQTTLSDLVAMLRSGSGSTSASASGSGSGGSNSAAPVAAFNEALAMPQSHPTVPFSQQAMSGPSSAVLGPDPESISGGVGPGVGRGGGDGSMAMFPSQNHSHTNSLNSRSDLSTSTISHDQRSNGGGLPTLSGRPGQLGQPGQAAPQPQRVQQLQQQHQLHQHQLQQHQLQQHQQRHQQLQVPPGATAPQGPPAWGQEAQNDRWLFPLWLDEESESPTPNDMLPPNEDGQNGGGDPNSAGVVSGEAGPGSAAGGGGVAGPSLSAAVPSKRGAEATTDGRRKRGPYMSPSSVSQPDPPPPPVPLKPRHRKTNITQQLDCIDEGLVSEAEARELVQLFYSGAHDFVLCFDPKRDTFESLKSRAPFALTAMISVGALVRDGSKGESTVQRRCRDLARKMAMGTLFKNVFPPDVVQALILLGAWGDSPPGYIVSGHALRVGAEMGLHKAFSKLMLTGMGKNRTAAEVEEERTLVETARLWFSLHLLDGDTAYCASDYPVFLSHGDPTSHSRQFLDHPLSIESDVRLVASVELMTQISVIHQQLCVTLNGPSWEEIEHLCKNIVGWEKYWDKVMADKGLPKEHFYRESLIWQKHHWLMFIKGGVLNGIDNIAKVRSPLFTTKKRGFALEALKHSQDIMDLCITHAFGKTALKFGTLCVHMSLWQSTTFPLYRGRFFPEALDLRKVAKDLEAMTCMFQEAPTGKLGRHIKSLVPRARRVKLLPPPTPEASPTRPTLSLPPTAGVLVPPPPPMPVLSIQVPVGPQGPPGPTTGTVPFSPSTGPTSSSASASSMSMRMPNAAFLPTTPRSSLPLLPPQMLPPDSRPPPGVAVQGMPDGGAGQQPQFHYMYGQDHTNLQVGQGDMLYTSPSMMFSVVSPSEPSSFFSLDNYYVQGMASFGAGPPAGPSPSSGQPGQPSSAILPPPTQEQPPFDPTMGQQYMMW